MRPWHALAACAAALLALMWFRASSEPPRGRPRNTPLVEVAEVVQPAEEEARPEPAKAPEAPSPPAPTPALVVQVRDAAKDAPEAWTRTAPEGLTDEEKGAVERHLTRFVQTAPPEKDASLALLPKADPDAAEKRRIEQLELLRQRKALGLLGHVGQGLAWLALHQGPDGKISEATAAGRCTELGHEPSCAEVHAPMASDDQAATAATGLAILAMLDFRDQDKQGIFEPTLAHAVTWLRSQQREDGTFPGRPYYATAISLMALAEAASSTGSDDLRAAVQRGLARLAKEQGIDGGFRYRPLDPGDVSVTVWVAQALEAARRARVEVPPEMDAGLRRFFDGVWLGEHKFSYLAGQGERWSLDPAGMLLGLILDPPAADGSWVRAGVLEIWRRWLKDAPRQGIRRGGYGLYSFYYGVRVVIALEPELSDDWRRAILDLAATQHASGPRAGSFEENRRVGAVIETALSVLTLEHALYKR